eukprot:GHVT01090043.1.p2 GENE.GHVT01090043.1~~GHVT01090043.1.p2  ORF type:complete len:185 (+),score=20.91 GHVT01090043.1:977-1531(+)
MSKLTGSTYEGARHPNGWAAGRGLYTFPDGVVYDGNFQRGEFHGTGTMTAPAGGSYIGEWRNGRAVTGRYVFHDGLEHHPDQWKYLSKLDRRYHQEIQAFGTTKGQPYHRENEPRQLHRQSYQIANPPPGQVVAPPKGFYDTGDGYYDPASGQVVAYHDLTVVVSKPSVEEVKWILERCKRQNA